MRKSDDRILTTHIGSLPRSPALLDMLVQMEAGQAVDPDAFRTRLADDMDEIVRKQVEVGIDVAGDGELPRIGFSFYVKDRMSGFGGVAQRGTVTDFAKFPGYAALKFGAHKTSEDDEKDITQSASMYAAPECQGEVVYDPELGRCEGGARRVRRRDRACRRGGQVRRDLRDGGDPRHHLDDAAAHRRQPSICQRPRLSVCVGGRTQEGIRLRRLAGHTLQLDAPDLALERQIMFHDRPLDEFLERVALHIEALNLALADIPPEKVRLHVCWGNWDGPHLDDVDLEPLIPHLYAARVGALSIAFANPRHQHDWKKFKAHPLPDSMILMPGVIDVTTNYLEHPEVVADRLCQFAEVVGDRSRIVAAADCGFSTFAGYVMVPADVAWKKLEMLTEGARLASERLWS